MKKDRGITITNIDKQKQCDIHVVVRSFLKDNLTVQIETKKEYDYGNEYTVVTSYIYLGSEIISESSDTIY